MRKLPKRKRPHLGQYPDPALATPGNLLSQSS
ncbi:hypothetical protein Ptr902_00576 [Pyrenophora tritici-repentis]|nr:hypothetical protein Ptr902_00576 [Pyrenophora tritici-repentis]